MRPLLATFYIRKYWGSMEMLLLEVKEDSKRIGRHFINIDTNYYL